MRALHVPNQRLENICTGDDRRSCSQWSSHLKHPMVMIGFRFDRARVRHQQRNECCTVVPVRIAAYSCPHQKTLGCCRQTEH